MIGDANIVDFLLQFLGQFDGIDVIKAFSAIGAGTAMIAGVGPGIGRDLPPVKAQKLWEFGPILKVILFEQCYWGQQLLKPLVFMG